MRLRRSSRSDADSMAGMTIMEILKTVRYLVWSRQMEPL